MLEPRRWVYIIRSVPQPWRYYTGLTSNAEVRLGVHNRGECRHTASGRPWRLVLAAELEDQDKAVKFEAYLKTGSGRAFANRHFR